MLFADVRRLETFGAFYGFKINRFAFLQGFESVTCDGGEVYEDFLTAIIWSDKTESFCVV